MSDNQFAILITVIGAGLSGIGLAIRFSVGRIVKSFDDSTAALLKNTESNAILATKIDAISVYVRSATPTPPLGIAKGGQ